MKTTVIFDLDGLLIDSEVISYRLYQELVGEYGHSFALEEYACNYSGKTGIANMETLIDRFQLPVTVQEGFDYIKEKGKVYYDKGVDLKPGAGKLLEYLKVHGYQVMLATSSSEERALRILEQDGIRDYFHKMVFGTELQHSKPAPDIFLKACEKAEESPEQCLVLEDSEAGIQAAHSAGIDVICVPDMKMPGEQFQNMATEILSSLADVIPWLEKQSK